MAAGSSDPISVGNLPRNLVGQTQEGRGNSKGNVLQEGRRTLQPPRDRVRMHSGSDELFTEVRVCSAAPPVRAHVCTQHRKSLLVILSTQGHRNLVFLFDNVCILYNELNTFRNVKSLEVALAGVAQWIEHLPANQKVTGSVPCQGTCLFWSQVLSWGCARGNQFNQCFPHRCFSPFLPPSPSL